jgi:hypothetical protein
MSLLRMLKGFATKTQRLKGIREQFDLRVFVSLWQIEKYCY